MKNGGGNGQVQIGDDVMSGTDGIGPFPPGADGVMVIPAIFIGKIHCQHTSVIGFRNPEGHFASALFADIQRNAVVRRIMIIFPAFNIKFFNLHILPFLLNYRRHGF